MKKKIFLIIKILLIILIIFVALIGISVWDAIKKDQKTLSLYIPTEEEFAIAAEEMGSDITSGCISIDGTVYTFPCTVADFMENDWALEEYLMEDYSKVPANSQTMNAVDMTKVVDGNEMEFSIGILKNEKMESVPIEEIPIRGLTIQNHKYNHVKVILPGSISWKTSMDEIKEMLGEPNEEKELNDGQLRLFYDNVNGTKCNVYFAFWPNTEKDTYSLCEIGYGISE